MGLSRGGSIGRRSREKRLVSSRALVRSLVIYRNRKNLQKHSTLEEGKQMKGGIMSRLQEAKLRRLDKSLIECRLLLLSQDFPLHLIFKRGREAKLSELYKADHYISHWRRKPEELPLISC
ncbi:hypothetical protein ACOSP7_019029 [Xanthoceras sorbifolium]